MSAGFGWLGEVLAILGVIASTVFSGLLVAAIDDRRGYAQIRAWLLGMSFVERYRARGRRLLAWSRLFYGRSMSFRAFDRCLALALGYPVILWIASWAITGQQMSVSAAALHAVDRPVARIGTLLVVVVSAVIAGAIVSNRADEIVSAVLQRRPIKLRPYVARVLSFVLRTGLVGIFVGVTASVGAGVAGIAGVAGVTVVSGVLFGTVGAGVVVAAGVATVAVAGALTALVMGPPGGAAGTGAEVLIVWALFFVALPVGNAVMDWLSLAASRRLLKHLFLGRRTTPGPMAVLVHLLFDGVLAAIFLVLLAILLPAVLQLWNVTVSAAAGFAPVDWRSYVVAARDGPWWANLTVVGMLATTLVPTVVHLVAACGTLVPPNSRIDPVVRLLRKKRPSFVDKSIAVGLFAATTLVSWLLLVAVVVVLYALVVEVSGIGPAWLADVALWAGGSIR